ncbi:MAG: hypothetical protein WBG71_08635 [Leeuwenhoekiella sp.]
MNRKLLKIWLLFYTTVCVISNIRAQNDSGFHQGLGENQIRVLLDRGYVEYSDFGAVGDGLNDDTAAIAKTHQFANHFDLEVKAQDEATYYIGGTDSFATIQTNTTFGSATFIIDDRSVVNRKAPIFKIKSRLQSFGIAYKTSLKKNQEKLNVSLPTNCLITVSNNQQKVFKRKGLNQNDGHTQTDLFIVDQDGNINPETPIIWNFDQVTQMTAIPIDSSTLTIRGGRFVTIANHSDSEYNYFKRNISINRSNVMIDGLMHRISGEGSKGAPYLGFISIAESYNVLVKNTILTGHKEYTTLGFQGKPVSMGSYDISVNSSIDVSFVNCSQTNDINDSTYWGIMASNFCKNLIYDNCKLSRFDAHMGVYNATICNSTLGHMGINAIGSGTLTIKNSTVRAKYFINLRKDYGSTWQGKFMIYNCTFQPTEGNGKDVILINGSNSGQHDFGYVCYMPESILIENLLIDEINLDGNDYQPVVFADFNSKMASNAYTEHFPYIKTKYLILKNLKYNSNKPVKISDNAFMFKNIEIKGNTQYELF